MYKILLAVDGWTFAIFIICWTQCAVHIDLHELETGIRIFIRQHTNCYLELMFLWVTTCDSIHCYQCFCGSRPESKFPMQRKPRISIELCPFKYLPFNFCMNRAQLILLLHVAFFFLGPEVGVCWVTSTSPPSWTPSAQVTTKE